MHKDIIIDFINVHQSYPLYQNPREMLMGVLGISKLLGKEKNTPIFHALKGINLTIYKGDRIGIIGENGAGKTTLLKLATENFFPTKGDVKINGKVQSLMDSGVGFHPEFTGLENIRSSLIYNGLTTLETEKAIQDIIEFSELGDFINQPIKTYSLGMISRLGFATSTALNPEILIIDEIMGAGDAYFAAKSAERMKNLTKEGTTLLLVSHSTSQVIQFCKQAIWMKDGQIHMKGDVLEVGKTYEKFMREKEERRLEAANQARKVKQISEENISKKDVVVSNSDISESFITNESSPLEEKEVELLSRLNKKEQLNVSEETSSKRSESRWKGLGGLLINDFYITDSHNQRRYTFQTGEMIKFIIQVKAEKAGTYPCTYVMMTYTLSGLPVTLHSYTQEEEFEKDETKNFEITYPELMLGNGDFVVSIALYKNLDLNDASAALFYDLLDRSFEFKVINKFKDDRTTFLHPAQWKKHNE